MSIPERDPTPAELAILRVLWARGPSTVRQVFDEISRKGSMVYTTTLKTMQIMHDKGFVVRDTSCRSHVYTPVHPAAAVQEGLVSSLAARAFGGSASRLAMRALSAGPVSHDEIANLRALLDDLESRTDEAP